MQVTVIGAGVVGAATALELTLRGHRVTVIDGADAAAQGASFANAGLVSPGHSFSWASPGVVKALGGVVAGTDDAMGIARWTDPALWPWGLRFLRECTAARWQRNSAASVALSAYSRNLLAAQREVPAADYGHAHAGIVYLQAPGQPCDAHELALLDAAREPYEIIGGERIAQLDPLLALSTQRFGAGIFCPQDATGNARSYAQAALQAAQARGAELRWGEQVQGFVEARGRVTGVRTPRGLHPCDAVVLAGGLGAAQLARPLGYRLPIYPVTGYSVTYAHDPAGQAPQPRVGAVSLQHKIAWASFGSAVRFTGFADIGVPRDPARVRQRMAALEQFAATVYAPAAHLPPARWMGQRPMTPDGLPVLGRGRHGNLYFNCGHGAMGWTMASGSARLVSDQLEGTSPAIDMAPYRWNRF